MGSLSGAPSQTGLNRGCLMIKYLLTTNGKIRRNSDRNDPRSTGGHPQVQLKKGDTK